MRIMSASQLAVEASAEHAPSSSAELIRTEYREMPGLRLTKRQIQRMWSLDPDSCDMLVEMLVAEKFLIRAGAGYVRGPRSPSE